MFFRRIAALVLIVLASTASRSVAQTNSNDSPRDLLPATPRNVIPPRDVLPPPIPAPPTGSERRDPTQLQGELQQLLGQQPNSTVPVALAALPDITLQARIIGPRKSTALLRLDEKRMMAVQSGTSYFMPLGTDQEMKVIAISLDGVELEFAPSKRRLLLP